MKQFGLIGKTLKHSFSANYFGEKFRLENIQDCRYDLFELASITEFPGLIEQESPVGLNVTIPYKQEVIQYLHTLDESARRVGAVNVIHRSGAKLTGYNSDYYGFKKSLENWLPSSRFKALVLGTGGASKAVIVALEDLQIPYKSVSRSRKGDLTYDELDLARAQDYKLWINTTPLGTYPNVDDAPALPFDALTSSHYLYDLVYNPRTTQFMQMGNSKGANTKNGLEMLYLQAERSWEIWNK